MFDVPAISRTGLSPPQAFDSMIVVLVPCLWLGLGRSGSGIWLSGLSGTSASDGAWPGRKQHPAGLHGFKIEYRLENSGDVDQFTDKAVAVIDPVDPEDAATARVVFDDRHEIAAAPSSVSVGKPRILIFTSP